MAKVYFGREEISIEVPMGISVLEAEIRRGLRRMRLVGGREPAGNVW